MVPIASALRRYEKISMAELAERFKNSDLQRAKSKKLIWKHH